MRIVIESASVYTAHRRRDQHLRSADFLNAAEYPQMIYTATAARRTGERTFEIDGQLQLLGRTQPVQLRATWNKSARYELPGSRAYVMGVSARGTFKRSAFGMKYGVDNGWVGDEVELITRVRGTAAVRSVLFAGAAALLLNVALTFENLWPTPWVRPAAALSVEAALLVLGIALLVSRGVFTPRVRAVLAGLVVVMALTHYAEVTALALYGRPVNLYWDAQHLPRVAAMVAAAASPAQLAAAAAGTALGLFALGVVCARHGGCARRRDGRRRARVACSAAARRRWSRCTRSVRRPMPSTAMRGSPSR